MANFFPIRGLIRSRLIVYNRFRNAKNFHASFRIRTAELGKWRSGLFHSAILLNSTSSLWSSSLWFTCRKCCICSIGKLFFYIFPVVQEARVNLPTLISYICTLKCFNRYQYLWRSIKTAKSSQIYVFSCIYEKKFHEVILQFFYSIKHYEHCCFLNFVLKEEEWLIHNVS